MNADRIIEIALVWSTGLLWALYFLSVDSPVRAVVAILYLLVAPGLAVISLLALEQRWAAAVLSVALSLGLITIVTTALLLLNLWTPGRALAIIGCITLIATGARLALVTRSQVPDVIPLPREERQSDAHEHAESGNRSRHWWSGLHREPSG